MNHFNKITKVALIFLVGLGLSGCKDLTELNINPNGVSEENANPNLLLTTILTGMGSKYNELSFVNLGGVVQHTQYDAWFDSHNDYEWTGGILSWDPYYGYLRDNELLRRHAEEQGLEFHHGVSLVVRAYLFGLITDLWGDAPYTDAVKAELGDVKYNFPKFDSQEVIYKGIIEELAQANELLSKPDGAYTSILPAADVFFNGQASKWRRFANALALRYYMRLSEKETAFARQGIEQIMADPNKFPIISSVEEEVLMSFAGNNAADSWPSNTVYDASGSSYRRVKMASTLVNRLQAINDPRLAIWAKKVEIPLQVSATEPPKTSKIVNGVRILSPDMVQGIAIDTDPEYVGLPPSGSKNPSAYNLNPTPGQTSMNPHVSYINDIYREAKGDLLKARLLSAAEVDFILAEAAWKGWNLPASAKTYYERGILHSLESWGSANAYATYIQQNGVAFQNTQAQILEQKWIASWTTAAQSWFDYRRTGLPALKAGPSAIRTQLPVRIPYMPNEMSVNQKNAEEALTRIEKTTYSQADNENSAWSKPWLLQGTNKPW
ncbi:SusD/RagB family nutrient-binding outer membrane lipoprotein [Sphingobacterium corticibacter]|uniref:SusD/RagB family nutrient-binding outer membrane lipoprotein n=1 Tax=Sphingobacterium corticibacter TaxID=2171749 RepID=A0A2T8HFU2_9SPHI|nr:SusD/RagB family nutrient-binding outer membrane lipoprotein [Sphingobacterium corticibacter]PVH24317.1 SusD/RagB family nutrient-binding outer membrane lipoprotein [Sphingobacterium corticibacter]